MNNSNDGGNPMTADSVPVSYGNVTMSGTIPNLAAALAAAQGKIETASKDSVNPHFNSRYANLAAVWAACREALSAVGIAVIQNPSVVGADVTVTTMVLHKSGEWIMGSLSATADKKTAQGIGSVITYLRRYGLSAMVGIAPDEDDDANAGSPAPNSKSYKSGSARAAETEAPEVIMSRINSRLDLIDPTRLELIKATIEKAGNNVPTLLAIEQRINILTNVEKTSEN